jgi:hypothetical protein
VCRYTGTADAYVLAESRVLDADDSASWWAAVEAAPAVSDADNACDSTGGEAFLVSSSEGAVAFIEQDSCGRGYVLVADGEKKVYGELTGPLGSQLATFG